MRRVKIDWLNGTLADEWTGEAVTIEDAMTRGLIDVDTAQLLRRKNRDVMQNGAASMRNGVDAKENDVTVTDTLMMTVQTTHLLQPEMRSLVVQDAPAQKTTTTSLASGAGLLSFEHALKMQLFNLTSSKMRHPTSGDLMSLDDAIAEGLIDVQAPAVRDLRTGHVLSLREAFDIKLVDERTGRVDVMKAERMRLTLDPVLTGGDSDTMSLNLDDALTVGLFDVDCGKIFTS